MDDSNIIIKKRIFSVFIVFAIILSILIGRLLWIQVFQTAELAVLAMEQRLRQLNIEAIRGTIYDNAARELAVSTVAETVVALPREIENAPATARELAQVLNLPYQEILRRIEQPRVAIFLERKLPEERAEQVRALNITGITFVEESQRFYPQDSLASHIIGFAGMDSQGLEGIEMTMENYLTGTAGRVLAEKEPSGLNLPQGLQSYVSPQDGMDIYLTIDQVIQHIAERELAKAMADNDAKGGTIIVMDSSTGGILAMANSPDFNPNSFQSFPASTFRNPAISNSYEPGSAFKVITMAAALEEGIVNIEDRFFCSGGINVSGHHIQCWRAQGHGSQNFADIMAHSCNPGFVQVGVKIGRDLFYDYIRAFGFGDRLGIELPGEARGQVYERHQIGPVELATMTFGHGIAVTPLQMASAMAAIGNGGYLLKPQIISEIRENNGELVFRNETAIIRQVISEQTAELTLALLLEAVDSGTGSLAHIEGYQIGGKTGTAKHYDRDVYDSSFVGIVPVDDPQVVILVVLFEVASYPFYGGTIAAPVFKEVALDTIRYLGIKPTVFEEVPEVKAQTAQQIVPNVCNQELYSAVQSLRDLGFNVRVEGSGDYVQEQIPLAGAKVAKGSTVALFFDNSLQQMQRYHILVPNVRGLLTADAKNILESLGFKVQINSAGAVRSQSPRAGQRVVPGSLIILN